MVGAELLGQPGPAGVHDLVGVVGRQVVEALAAVDAQPGAVRRCRPAPGAGSRTTVSRTSGSRSRKSPSMRRTSSSSLVASVVLPS